MFDGFKIKNQRKTENWLIAPRFYLDCQQGEEQEEKTFTIGERAAACSSIAESSKQWSHPRVSAKALNQHKRWDLVYFADWFGVVRVHNLGRHHSFDRHWPNRYTNERDDGLDQGNPEHRARSVAANRKRKARHQEGIREFVLDDTIDWHSAACSTQEREWRVEGQHRAKECHRVEIDKCASTEDKVDRNNTGRNSSRNKRIRRAREARRHMHVRLPHNTIEGQNNRYEEILNRIRADWHPRSRWQNKSYECFPTSSEVNGQMPNRWTW